MSLFDVRDAEEALTLVCSSRAIFELLCTQQRPAQLCKLFKSREDNVTAVDSRSYHRVVHSLHGYQSNHCIRIPPSSETTFPLTCHFRNHASTSCFSF